MQTSTAEQTDTKNRYKSALRNADYTIDQNWESYSSAEHNRWDRLFGRCRDVLKERACPEFLAALEDLQLSESGIPNMVELSDRLEALTGWRVVPVADLVPDDIFFDHLANRRFPAGAFIRPEAEIDYLTEPDVFHDIFGHVPLLANPVYSDFMVAYGKGGQRALSLDMLPNLARLYWYTVEFGLVKSRSGLKIFGAGILSSTGESKFALENESPHRLRFDLSRIMKTEYIIDDFQQTYFVIDSFENLLEDCYQDFGELYKKLKSAPTIEAGDLRPEDEVVTRGTLDYFRN